MWIVDREVHPRHDVDAVWKHHNIQAVWVPCGSELNAGDSSALVVRADWIREEHELWTKLQNLFGVARPEYPGSPIGFPIRF